MLSNIHYFMKKITILLLTAFYCLTGFSQGLVENFDNGTITTPSGSTWNLPDSGTWRIFDNGVGAIQNWTLNTEGVYPANTQPRAAYINRENIGQGNTSRDFLVTPLVTLPANAQLRFQTRTTLATSNGTIFEVRAASATSNPALPESYTTLIASWTEADLTAAFDVYEEKIVPLSLPEPAMYIAFVKVVTQTGTSAIGDRWLIDDVKIIGICPDSENLSATATASSALLTWDSPGPATQWNVHVLPAGVPLTDPSVGTPILATAPNANDGFTVTQTTQNPPQNILAGSNYVFWIKSVCEYNSAQWVASSTFMTDVLGPVCGGNYVDEGGINGPYLTNTNSITTICPGPGEIVTVTFTEFETEIGFDGIYVYDGDSINSPRILSTNGPGYTLLAASGAFWGIDIPGPFTSTSADGCLTFQFLSGGSNNQDGFLASIVCSPAPACQKPTGVTVLPQTTLTTATVGWTAVGVASQWLVYAVPCGSAVPVPGSDGGVLTDQTTLVIQDLTPATCYDIIIFAVCDGSFYSDPTLPQTAVTLVPEPVCGGIFQDPAGPMNYTANTNYTITICPDNPGELVVVDFFEFDIKNMDGMYIYDGDSTSAPQFDSGNTQTWLPYILVPGAYWGTELPGTFTASSETGCLTFHFMSGPVVHGEGWKANVTCIPAPACQKPTALTAVVPSGNPSPTNVEIGWTNIGEANAWEVFAVECGSPPPTADSVGLTTSQTSLVYPDLDPETCYDFYVRANCSSTDEGLSTWAGPVSFTTEPAPVACGGVFKDLGEDGDYPFFSNSIVTICPENVGDIVTVVFTSFDVNGNEDGLYVFDGTTISAPQIASNNGPGNPEFNNMQLPGAFWGTELPGPFEATNSSGCLTFRFVSNNFFSWISTSRPGWTADVICTPAPTCAKPTDINVAAVTQTTVTVEWTEMGTATEWQVLVLPYTDPFPSPGATGWQTANTNPFTFNSLTPGLPYRVYVRAACSSDNLSTWSYYKEFHTPINNDFCVGAIEVPVNPDANCGQIVEGTLFGALPSGISSGPSGICSGTDNADVWYKFTAIGPKHYILLTSTINGNFAGYIPVFSLFSGNCESGLTYMACYSGPTDTAFQHIIAEDLIPGQTYYLQVYRQGDLPDNFNVCIGTLQRAVLISEQYTPEELVHDILFDSTCAIINNVTSSTGTGVGSVNGIGYFNRNGTSFPFEEGVILSSGTVSKAMGPNNTNQLYEGKYPLAEDGLNPLWEGDDDLEAIILAGTGNPMNSYNATKLEFDFIPITPSINFNFLFASEEYGFYQCNYSDAFAFILTDLSVPGSEAQNLAVLPGTQIPISVVTIRDALYNLDFDCASVNPEYFDTFYALGLGVPPMTAPINFNGVTVPLTAYSEVIPGHQYHIKLVIADRGDASLDSAVFLEAGSFDIGNIRLGDDLTIANGTAVCGESYSIETGLAAADYTFVWTNNDGVIPGETGPSLSVTDNGTYNVTATLNNSECSSNDTIVVQFINEANGVFPDIVQCTSYTFPVLALGNFYSLPNGEGDVLGGTTITSAQNLEVYYYHNAGPNCIAEDTFTITIGEIIAATLPDVIVCDTYTLPVLPIGNTYNTAADCSGTVLNAGAVIDQSQTIHICAQIGTCSDSSDFTVTVITSPVLTPVENVTSCGSYILPTLQAGAYYGTSGGLDPIYEVTQVGINTVYVYQGTGLDGCSREISFTVTIAESVELHEITDVFSCQSYTLPEIQGVVYYNGPNKTGGIITSVSVTQPVYAYMQGPTDACSAEQLFTVSITNTPQLQIVGGCIKNEYVLNVNILNAVAGAEYVYSWTNQGGEIESFVNDPGITVSGEGTYTVTVTLNNCSGNDDELVTSTSCMIQKGISVNGDGANDFFDLEGFDVKKLQIFNRYGIKVYERSPYSNQWGGQSDKGEELPDGTYYYVIDFNDDRPAKTGWIYINRER
jgi:gliding motility-associated-like protein